MVGNEVKLPARHLKCGMVVNLHRLRIKRISHFAQAVNAWLGDAGRILSLSLVGRRCCAAEAGISTKTPADPQVSPTFLF
jgi:hypothetical protein